MFATVWFTYDKTVEVFNSEIYVLKQFSFYVQHKKNLKSIFIIYSNVNALMDASQRNFQGNNQSVNHLNLLRQ